jgi:hypothetical protein
LISRFTISCGVRGQSLYNPSILSTSATIFKGIFASDIFTSLNVRFTMLIKTLDQLSNSLWCGHGQPRFLVSLFQAYKETPVRASPRIVGRKYKTISGGKRTASRFNPYALFYIGNLNGCGPNLSKQSEPQHTVSKKPFPINRRE